MLLYLLWAILIFLGTLVYFSARWYIRAYGDMGFSSILFTLLNGIQTTAGSLIGEWLKNALVPCLLVMLVLTLVLILPDAAHIDLVVKNRKHFRLFPFSKKLVRIGGMVAAAAMLWCGADLAGFPRWLKERSQQTTIYQDEYVAPNAENVVFAGEKRNLIYIYLESMETSLFSIEQGGARPYCVIPELYELARSNINFSNNDGVGGGTDTAANYTTGAMVAQTMGLPVITSFAPGYGYGSGERDPNLFGNDHPFMPGAKGLCDILHENGYYQTLMVGSASNFGGRRPLYLQHNTDHVYDLFTASEDGIIDPDYQVWWGFEDQYLFEYARQELLKIAQQEQPFAFTMLTVDTHFPDGYVCELCQNQYAEQYENVYACSSRQVCEFVQWIQQQDFYENTTIVISGDHLTMDNEYTSRNVSENYDRRVYNCIINAAVTSVHTNNRIFTTMDMFPTTLAAMGATIAGDRLGLGTDLFSAAPTLAEQYGLEWLETELAKSSDYYITHFATKGE